MRKIAFILVVLLLALAMASCYWAPLQGSGELTVRLSGATKGLGDWAARVWLLTEDNALVPIGTSTDYAEAVISETETQVTVEKIPAGPRYKVLLSVGTVEDGWFRVERWAESDLFEISAGSTVDVPVTPKAAPFGYGSDAVMGTYLRGLVLSGGSLFAVSPVTLYTGANAAGMAEAGDLPAGYMANSLSIGIPLGLATDVWVNTDRGILPFTGSAFDTFLCQNLGEVSILESGAFTVTDVTTLKFLFFQRDGGLGGADISDYPPTPPLPADSAMEGNKWVDIDVSEFVSGQPVQDFYVDTTLDNEKAYFITKLGSFGADRSLLEDTGEDPDLLGLVVFFDVEDGNVPILAIEKSATGFLLGTFDGVWKTDGETITADSVFTPIPGTRGFSFHKLAASGADWAALSPYYLFVSDGAEVKDIPFSAGLPGKVSAMVWKDGTLVIAGSEGLVEITP